MEDVGGEHDIGDAGDDHRLAVVQRFQLRQFIGVLEDQIADLVQQLAAIGRRHLAPLAVVVEGTTGRSNGGIDVFLAAALGMRHDLASGRVVDFKGFAGRRIHPGAVDQNLLRGADELAGFCAQCFQTF